MSVIPLISILIRLAAVGWSIVVLCRLRDRRMGLYTAMLALMVVTQVFASLASMGARDELAASVTGVLTELPGLALSILAFFGVFFLEGVLRRSDDERPGLVMSRRLAGSAVLIGGLTILASFAVGYLAYGESRAGMIRTIADGNLSLARRLGTHALTHLDPAAADPRAVVSELARLWDETKPLYEGSYLCVVENPGVVALHTAAPEVVGRDVGGVAVPIPTEAPFTVTDLLAAGQDWAGANRNSRGLSQIVGYAYFEELDGAIVVHTPMRLVAADLRAAATPWVVGLALTGGLLVPLLIGLLHGSYASAQRSFLRTERNREQLEKQLRHSQKMEAVGRLAGGVAHDFNNLLTSVFGNVELARTSLEDGFATGSVRTCLDEIERAAERAAGLTRQLLTFSRKQDVKLTTLDLNRTVKGLHTMLRRLLGEDIKLDVDVDPELPFIRADAGWIEQIVLNLAVNARDAMPRGGTLRIRTYRATVEADRGLQAQGGLHAVLEVSDSGSGMSERVLQHIFDPFFTTKAQDKGTGLGLSTVYGIVQQLGGRIHVDSEVGRGASFTVRFPASVGEVARPEVKVPSDRPRGKGEAVLVCEDDLSVRELVCGVLERGGYRVVPAEDGTRAIALARDHDPPIRLLVTDVVLPDTDGCSVARTLQRERPELEVLCTSGYTGDVAAERGFRWDEVEFLSKPFTSAELLDRVAALLDPSRPRVGPRGEISESDPAA